MRRIYRFDPQKPGPLEPIPKAVFKRALRVLFAEVDVDRFGIAGLARVYAARFGAHRRRQGKGMLAETDVLRRTATLQAAYFLMTGLWPIVSRPTFEAVTGPKTDYWLVRTVGALASVIGTTLGVASYRNRVSSELAVLGVGSALAFGVVDVFYATTGRISRVYLVDAAVECLIAGGWASGLQRS